jgi:hypothetical protein
MIDGIIPGNFFIKQFNHLNSFFVEMVELNREALFVFGLFGFIGLVGCIELVDCMVLGSCIELGSCKVEDSCIVVDSLGTLGIDMPDFHFDMECFIILLMCVLDYFSFPFYMNIFPNNLYEYLSDNNK